MSWCDVCCLSSFQSSDTIAVLSDTIRFCSDGCILTSLFDISVYVHCKSQRKQHYASHIDGKSQAVSSALIGTVPPLTIAFLIPNDVEVLVTKNMTFDSDLTVEEAIVEQACSSKVFTL